MQKLSSDQIAQLTFDNSLVTEMQVNPESKTLTIHCDRAFLDQGDESLEIQDLVLSVVGYDVIRARIYNDEDFEIVEATNKTYHFADLCEFTHEGSKIMISGFSTQEGSWSDYSIEGGDFSVAHA